MAALAHRTEAPNSGIPSFRGPQALGVEGRFVLEEEQKAYRHLSESVSSLLTADGDLSYRSLPFQMTSTQRVRYRLVGRLLPLPFPDAE